MCSSKFKDFIDDFCESEKHRLPNFIPVGIGIGISLYFSLDREPNFSLNVTIFSLLFCITIFIKSHKVIFYILVTISFGFLISQIRTKTVDTFMLSERNDRPISLTATVESCEKTEQGMAFIVCDIDKDPKLNKLRLTWRGKKAMASEKRYIPGSRVSFRVILSPLSPQSFYGSYDFKKQQYFKGISARGFVIKPPYVLKECEGTRLHLLIEKLRYGIGEKIEKHLPADIAAVAKALITGNKSGISKEIRSHFANSGTAHLLAISGLHMGIIGFFIFWMFRVFLCCFPCICMFFDVKKIAAVISWIVVLFYLHVSGNSVPSVRAFIMHTIIVFAILLEKNALTMRSAAIAATTIMLLSPEAILFPSFQMSFGAVIAIIALYERRWNFYGFFKTLFNITATTVVASIPTAIFSIYTFNQLTLNSILANIVSVPMMTFFVMPVAMTSLFFMIFDIEDHIMSLMGYGVKFLMKISEFSSQLPGSHFVMSTPTSTNMSIFIFSGLILLLIHHRIRLCGIVGILIGVVYYFFNPTPDIFISPNAKAIGVKTKDDVCFNHLGHFRSVISAWARSVGFEKPKNFNAKGCRKYIKQISDGTYAANVKGQRVMITDDKDYFSRSSNAILLNRNNNFAEIIFLPSKRQESNESKIRPWT